MVETMEALIRDRKCKIGWGRNHEKEKCDCLGSFEFGAGGRLTWTSPGRRSGTGHYSRFCANGIDGDADSKRHDLDRFAWNDQERIDPDPRREDRRGRT